MTVAQEQLDQAPPGNRPAGAGQQGASQQGAGQLPAGAPVPAVLSILAGAMTATMLDLGARTGLNRALAAGPADPAELAERTGGNERLCAEWLRCLDAAGLLVQVGSRSRWTPDAAAMLAAPPGAGADLAAGVELFAALASSVPLVAEAFRTGAAVPADRYPAELGAAMQRMSDSWAVRVLPELWLPAIPGLADRLLAGGRVAEVGCGSGHALQAIGEHFPACSAEGFELDGRQVDDGNRRLAEAGLADRLQLRAEDAATGLRGRYDLVLALSMLHDAADLDTLLASIANSLAPQGHLLVVESPPLRGPLAAMLLATSTLYCVPSTLARGPVALGTLGLPPEVLIPAATRAGLALDPPLPAAMPLVVAYSFGRSDSEAAGV